MPSKTSSTGMLDKRKLLVALQSLKQGDFTARLNVEWQGLDGKIADTFNEVLDLNRRLVKELDRVKRVVGKEGKVGQRITLDQVEGSWSEAVESLNGLIDDLVWPTTEMSRVIGAVSNGDLSQTVVTEYDGRPLRGEFLRIARTVNTMVNRLSSFASEVTRVAREVGVEGKLGGQAKVPGASGTWKGLTDNVNQLTANLTGQVRAIAEVATAVTKGDLTRSIQVDAQGELEALKDTINQMIVNLRETTQKNSEQDWLKTNLAKFTLMLQGQKDLLTVAKRILSELAPVVAAQHGVFYLMHADEDEPTLKLMASYAYKERRQAGNDFKLGEGLVGQCALEKERILLNNVPSTSIMINSGLGEAPPLSIIVLPVLFEGQVKAVIELASFERFDATHQAFLGQLTESIGIVLNTIEANMRTEGLLRQSQSLAQELQRQQEELQQTNDELEEKAKLLVEQNAEVERKNREVEQARQALEEKASRLALTSKYKSEFLANMSHELRTPINSLLILAHQLSKNPEKNLTSRQARFAQTIHGAGSDLLALINDILDLSKIESGTVTLDLSDVSFPGMREYVERTFRHVAESKYLDFEVTLGEGLPRFMTTDVKRVQQVLKNLLANSFKFTEKGKVDLRIFGARRGWSPAHATLNRARAVVAFAVTDTGIGIH
ncbi:MAG TPA: GAF domain-containing protein, partial [Fibrobacteria bacterium]|nr:GAF domain-containing protein [Fibrobacteria bacterium]